MKPILATTRTRVPNVLLTRVRYCTNLLTTRTRTSKDMVSTNQNRSDRRDGQHWTRIGSIFSHMFRTVTKAKNDAAATCCVLVLLLAIFDILCLLFYAFTTISTMPPVPDTVVQEVRNLLAVVCRDACYKNLGRGAKIAEQEKFHEDNFHGSDECGCIVETFMEAKTPYSSAFENHALPNNRVGNEKRRDQLFELRSLLHCDPAAFYCINNEGLDKEDITTVKNTKLTGRNLYDRGAKACCHYKIFLKYFKAYASSRAGHPSGLVLEDMLMFVRQKVYVQFRGSQNVVGNTTKGKEYTEERLKTRSMAKPYIRAPLPMLWSYKSRYLRQLSKNTCTP